MKRQRAMDKKTKALLLLLQDGMPICAQPYQALGEKAGLSEEEVISRLEYLRKSEILKRVDFSLDTRKLGLVSTLVGCRIPKKEISRASRVIAGYGNITHNYLRQHRLNMWFTLNAPSQNRLKSTLRTLKNDLRAEELVSLPTEKVYKLKLRLNVA